jgi:hypothetical protein
MQIVKWITLAPEIPGHPLIYRAARADFNVRGWQGRLRYTAPTALFFCVLSRPPDYPPALRRTVPRRLVICVSKAPLAECASNELEDNHRERRPPADV